MLMTMNHILENRLSLVVAVLSACCLSGCGHSSDTPALSSVTGVVTIEGQPIQEGQITFLPDTTQGTEGPSFTGELHEDGSFSIHGPGGVEGAIPGHYKVVINSLPVSHEELMKTARQGRLKRSDFLRDSQIPPVYQSPKSSPLHVVVEAEQPNRYQFQLSTKRGVKISRSMQSL